MYVYFIKEAAMGSIKIGISRNVAKRMSELQRVIPQKLECLGCIEGNHMKEKNLHKQFSHLKIRGEWFKPDQELLDFLDQINLEPMIIHKKCTRATRMGYFM